MSRSPGLIRRLSEHLPDILHRSGSNSDSEFANAGGPAHFPLRTTSSRQQRKEERRLRRNSSSASKKAATAARSGIGSHVDDSMDDVAFREEWHMSKADEVKRMVEFLTALQSANKLRVDFEWSMYRRFLRARQHDIPRALEMWSKHLLWRDEIGADTILEDFKFEERDAFISLYPQGYCNVDKMGRPVYIQQLGQLQFKKLQELTTEERMIKFHVQEYERCVRYIMPACSLAAGKNIEQTFAILDAKGVGIRHLTGAVKKMLQQIIQVDQNNYPEMLGKTAIINGGAVISFVFPLIRPFLDKRTQNKIEVCPRDFVPTLLQHINAENLPEFLGGQSRATLLDDAGPWNDPRLVDQIEGELHKEGPRLKWPPEAHGTLVPASIASSLAGGSSRAGSVPGSGPVTPHSTAHIAVSPFLTSTLQPLPNGGRISEGNEIAGVPQPGHIHAVPIMRSPSSGSDMSAISADDGYASATDGGYMSASDGYASATESLASYSSMNSSAGRRNFSPQSHFSQLDDDATSRFRYDDGGALPLERPPSDSRVHASSWTDGTASGRKMVAGGAGGVAPRSGSHLLLSPRVATQHSLTARVQALETRVHQVRVSLGKDALQLPAMPPVGGPLMLRVEALETALDMLLAAEQANLEAIEAKRGCGCCGGCSIM